MRAPSLVAFFVLLGCTDRESAVAVPSRRVVAVDVEPSRIVLSPLSVITLRAIPRTLVSDTAFRPPVHWASANPSIASVDSLGNVAALSLGATTILASVDGVVGFADLSVQPRPGTCAPSLLVTPSSLSLQVSGTAMVGAQLRCAEGDASVRWATSAPYVATVSDAGVVRAEALGEAVVTAALRSDPTMAASVRVTVVR